MTEQKQAVEVEGDITEGKFGVFRGGDLREALLLSGIYELEEHGLAGFSLRRVASACGVSCAAPYKHFESKEAFISAILSYIHEKRDLLEEHICMVFPSVDKARLVELCLADIRFWIGNPHFRSVHMMEGKFEKGGVCRLGQKAEQSIFVYCEQTGNPFLPTAYLLRSLVYGAVLMLEDGTLKSDRETFLMLRDSFVRNIPDEHA